MNWHQYTYYTPLAAIDELCYNNENSETSENMCINCEIIAKSFLKRKKDADKHYAPLHRMLSEMLEQGKITLYAGDCRFEDAIAELDTEMHFTVCFYLRCKACGEIYFFGNCIRGAPVYRIVPDITKENLENRLWGREGEYFCNS